MTTNPFDPLIQRYERKLQTLRDFRSLLERDPEIVPALREALLEHTNGQSPKKLSVPGKPVKPNSRSGSLFDRVKAHFDSIGNDWQTTMQIREAVGAERGAISNLLYTARRDDFEYRNDPTSAKTKKWRLKGGVS